MLVIPLSHCSFIDTAGQEDIAMEKAHDFLANEEIMGCLYLVICFVKIIIYLHRYFWSCSELYDCVSTILPQKSLLYVKMISLFVYIPNNSLQGLTRIYFVSTWFCNNLKKNTKKKTHTRFNLISMK